MRKQQMVTSSDPAVLGKIDDILEVFSSAGAEQRQAIFDANLPLSNTTIMTNGMTAGQMGAQNKLGFANIEKLMNNLGDNIEEFVNKLHQLIQNIYEQLATGEN